MTQLTGFLGAAYPWVKAAHVTFVIFWMAGLFLLPRFYVYHHATTPGSAEDRAWIEREDRVRTIILTPAMIAVWLLGLMLAFHIDAFSQGWFMAKFALVVGLTRALAHDLADDGITVNCVVPGLIGTPRPRDKPEPAHHLTHQTITGNRGLPEDVAATVRFLCGPGARYINGQAIHTNGGAYLGV